MRLTALLLLLITLVPRVARADDRGAARQLAAKRFELRVEEQGWDGAALADLKAVYTSACSELAVNFTGDEKFDLEPIRIRHDKGGPIVLYQRTLRGELVVQLSAKGNFWSQHAYQIAHEFCHILCRFKDADRSNLWFEESLCELASIYALRQMAITWKSDAPYPNWRSYGQSLHDYADDVAGKHALPEGKSFATWFGETLGELSKDPTQRDLNGIVAVQLLPIFEATPEAWQAIPFLNVGRSKERQSFDDYLKAWHQNTPATLRHHVAKITGQFERG